MLALLVVLGCARQEVIELHIEEDEPTAFACLDPDGNPLVTRVEGMNPYRFRLVFDVIEMPLVFCEVTDVLRRCSDPGCPITPEMRSCHELEVEIPPEVFTAPDIDAQIARIINDALETQVGTVLTELPEERVMIRAVFTRQSCEQVQTDGFSPTEIMACTLTCPTHLPSWSGRLDLDLPTLSSPCNLGEVFGCATLESFAM